MSKKAYVSNIIMILLMILISLSITSCEQSVTNANTILVAYLNDDVVHEFKECTYYFKYSFEDDDGADENQLIIQHNGSKHIFILESLKHIEIIH